MSKYNLLISTISGVAMLVNSAKAETATTESADYQIIFSRQAVEMFQRIGKPDQATVVVCNKATGETYTATELAQEWPDQSYSWPDAKRIATIPKKDIVWLKTKSGPTPQAIQGICSPPIS